MNRQGMAPTNRGLGGIGQLQQPRNTQMPSANRLQQTTRMIPGSQNQWPFQSMAPGLPTPPSRAGGVGSNFAQTLGGNQAATSLDPSEFPSLSGGPSIQTQNHNQAIWSGQRQHTPMLQQQSQQQRVPPPQADSNQQTPGLRQQNLDDGFFSTASGNGMDEFRRAQNGVSVGQLPSGNAQPTNVEEFPPLGRGAGEIGGDRRMNMMQGVASGFGAVASGFPPGIGPNRPTSDLLRTNSRTMQPGNDTSLFSNMNEAQQSLGGNSPVPSQTITTSQTIPNNNTTTGADMPDPLKRNGSAGPRIMSDEEKYGLPGLLEAIKNGNGENFNLAMGHDLTTLGLELNSSEYAIYPTFSGPLAKGTARALTPDFVLPPCYTVTNVPPITEKLPNFSDETLFYIFYSYCGDILQESAAIELTYRSWRWHKTQRVWITKDANFPEPLPIDGESERGKYIVFNEKTWSRQQTEMILHYADLDDHISAAPVNTLPGPMGFT